MVRKLLGNSNLWLLVIILLAAILRFYRLPDYIQFLGDEGRDVLAVKRMIVNHEWTFLGPTASVGGFYIGALYYYFMLPFLLLFRLDPVGPAVLSALFGLALIYFTYRFCARFFNYRVGLLAAFLIAISPKMVDISRFSWNPNPMPLFSLLTIYFLYQSKISGRKFYSFLAGLCLGVLFELHYIDLAFAPIVGLGIILLFPWRQWLLQFLLVGAGWLLGNSPFLLFEVRHDFPNTRTALEFIFRGGKTVAPRSFNLIWLFNDISRILYEIVFGFRGIFLNSLLYGSLIALVLWIVINFRKKDNQPKIILLLLWLVLGVWGVGSYQGTLYDHYFGYLFPLPFILVSLGLSYLLSKKYLGVIFIVVISLLTYNELIRLYVWHPPNNLLQQTQSVDRIIMEMSSGLPYNLALITPGNSDHAYRYYLEVWGKPPVTILNPQLDPERKTVTSQLIVICEGSMECHPLGNPLWEVAGFGRANIEETRIGPAGITLYKLSHYQGPT